jgi:hypothetical protein
MLVRVERGSGKQPSCLTELSGGSDEKTWFSEVAGSTKMRA